MQRWKQRKTRRFWNVLQKVLYYVFNSNSMSCRTYSTYFFRVCILHLVCSLLFFSLLSWCRHTWGMGDFGIVVNMLHVLVLSLQLARSRQWINICFSVSILFDKFSEYIYLKKIYSCACPSGSRAHTHRHTRAHTMWIDNRVPYGKFIVLLLFDYHRIVVIIWAECAIHFIYKYIHTMESGEIRWSAQQLNTLQRRQHANGMGFMHAEFQHTRDCSIFDFDSHAYHYRGTFVDLVSGSH